MYAHQVVEDLERDLRCRQNRNDITSKHLKFYISKIKDAQKFHLGDRSDMWSFFKKQNKTVLFDGEMNDCWLPYDTCWFDFECGYPSDCNISKNERHSKLGCLVVSIDRPRRLFIAIPFTYIDARARWICPFQEIVVALNCDALDHDYIDIWPKDLVDKNSCVLMKKFMGAYREHLLANPAMMVFNFDFFEMCAESNVGQDAASMLFRETLVSFREEITLMNFALILLTCKNIKQIKIPAPKKLNKKREKKGLSPVFDHHTLEVLLPSSSEYGHAGSNSKTTRLHLCRGHFKTYTEDRPLFGRLTGRYWWQPQARGNKRRGFAGKDYNVVLAPESK